LVTAVGVGLIVSQPFRISGTLYARNTPVISKSSITLHNHSAGSAPYWHYVFTTVDIFSVPLTFCGEFYELEQSCVILGITMCTFLSSSFASLYTDVRISDNFAMVDILVSKLMRSWICACLCANNSKMFWVIYMARAYSPSRLCSSLG